MKSFFKLFSFLPALAMMYMIFSFSSQTGVESGNISRQVARVAVHVYEELSGRDFDQEQETYYIERLQYPIRKLAHMTEYFILAICVSLPCYVYGLRGWPLMIVAGIICVGFACTDEYHQSMVAGRGPSKKDVCIDSMGVFFGIILVRIVCWTCLLPGRAVHWIKGDRS